VIPYLKAVAEIGFRNSSIASVGQRCSVAADYAIATLRKSHLAEGQQTKT
jgi:hypothetical protein